MSRAWREELRRVRLEVTRTLVCALVGHRWCFVHDTTWADEAGVHHPHVRCERCLHVQRQPT